MKFNVTEQEANIILQALARQPFELVFTLIASIQTQASQQLNKVTKEKKNAIKS